MREITDQENSKYGHFSRNEFVIPDPFHNKFQVSSYMFA